MNLKRFKDVEVRKVYVTANKFPTEVKYKIFNDQIVIDLKEIIDGILDHQGIAKYKTERIDMQLPFDMNKVVTGNSIVLGIDKKRFLIRIPSGEVITSNQQKIDYDNTQPYRWKLPQWLKYIENLYFKYYGFNSIELDINDVNNVLKRGKVLGSIRTVILKIKGVKAFKCDENTVVEYLDWVFSTKHGKTNVCLGFLMSDVVIQDWIISRIKRDNLAGEQDGKVRKWDE
jgi:hypothetical protein